VVFSPDSKVVASGSRDQTARLWDAPTGDARAVLIGHSHEVTSVVFSLDGQVVASGSRDRTVRLWDTQTGDNRAVLTGHSHEITSVVFSPNGQMVASRSGDRTVRLWDAQTGDTRAVLTGHSNWISSVVFSPDGQLVASGSQDRTVRLWDVQEVKHRLTILLSSFPEQLNFHHDSDLLSINGTTYSVHSGMLATPDAARSHDSTRKPLLYAHGEWVVKHSHRILWLPREYRPLQQASYGDTIVLGFSDGRIVFLMWNI
jgi:WD40 repeat protein